MFQAAPRNTFIVRFRPAGPWRFGPGSGARDRVDLVYHSDAVFSAVSSAMASLGLIGPWIAATAQAPDAPAVRFSSFFPFQREHLFVAPPHSVWPPPESPRIRYKGARFAPLPVVQALLNEQAVEEDRWTVDGESECLVPAGKNSVRGPFRIAVRSNAAIDRLLPGRIALHSTACLDFAPDAGLWALVVFAHEEARAEWEQPVRAALRLLADSGFGAGRSRGWGRCEMPEWKPFAPAPAARDAAPLAGMAGNPGDAPPDGGSAEPENPVQMETAAETAAGPDRQAYWLLSLFAPAHADSIDWTRGSYSTISRGGRMETPGRWGELKPSALMISEGSVLFAAAEPRGAAQDIAPPGFPHPVFRSGFAVAFPIPWRGRA